MCLLAQTNIHYNFSISEGIPSSETYSAFQDSKNFIWFATDNGVVKYDGQVKTLFNAKNGLLDPVIFNFFEDPQGRIWFRSYSGKLFYYENEIVKAYKYNSKITPFSDHSIVSQIVIDSLNNLSFTTGSAFAKIDSSGGMETDEAKREVLKIKEVEDHIFTYAYGPLHKLNTVQVSNQSHNINLTDTTRRGQIICAVRWNEKIYVSILNNIFEYDGHRFKRVYESKSLIISLCKDRYNNLWVCYLNDGATFFKDNFLHPSTKFYDRQSVSNVLQDREGGYWFTTLESGVYYIPNLSIENIFHQGITKIKSVSAKGKVVITGDFSGELKVYDSTRAVILRKKYPSPILSIFHDRYSQVWVSADKTYLYDNSFKLRDSIAGTRIAYVESKEGSILSLNGGNIFNHLPDGHLKSTYHVKDLYRSFILDDSTFYLTTRAGLHTRSYDMRPKKVFHEFNNFKISNILHLNDSLLLLTTIGNGFLILNKSTNRFSLHNTDSDFYTNDIFAAVKTDDAVWLGTGKGIVSIKISSLLEKKLDYNLLTKESGLISNKINLLSLSNNVIWAFADEGISIIPVSNSVFANEEPIFYMQKVNTNNNNNDSNQYRYNENNIEFSFGVISFNNHETTFRYRLSDNDRWIETSSKKIELLSLAPGDYHLTLQYSLDHITWKNASIFYNFTIKAPWWNRWYSYLVLSVVILTISFFYFRYRQSAYRQKNHYLKIINDHQQKLIQSEIETLERERNRIAKDLHDGVGTNLSAIKLTVRQLLHHHKEPFADDIEEQFQTVMTEIKNIIYGLNPPSLERYGLFTALKNYINRISQNLPVAVQLKTFGQEINQYGMNIIIFRVIQELLSNSIKHSHAKNITIHLSSFEDLLSIIYEDDGVGFKYASTENGLGLDNIDSRIQSIHGTLKFDSGEFGISYQIEIPLQKNQDISYENNQNNTGGRS
jgi:signal transduction histidine kinase/ligand-binding sensor domain-containing protein